MKTKGFTLVELLVVIAILAILATVSVVGYTSYINNANKSVAVQELTQIRDAAVAYDLGGVDGDKDGVVSGAEFKAALAAAKFDVSKFDIDTATEGDDETAVTSVVYTYKEGVTATWTVSTNKIQ